MKIKVGSRVKLNVGRYAGTGKVVKIQGDVAQVACAAKKRTYRRRITTLLLGMMAMLVMLPAMAFGQPAAPVTDPGSDPMAFVNQILAAAHAHNWLLAIPLGALLVIWALRKFGAAILKVAWFAGDQGGAVLAILAAVAEAVVAAALLPGPHAVAATVLWIGVTLFRNHLLYALLKKATIGTRFASWFALLPADPADPAVPGGTVPPVVKALVLLSLGAGLLVSSPAHAQVAEAVPATTATPAADAPTGNGTVTEDGFSVLWNLGPTVPFLLYMKDQNAVSVAPGAGIQLSLTLPQLQRALLGRAWDLLDLTLMGFGSMLTRDDGQQFGALSVAGGFCTLSSLLCVIGGKQILDSGRGIVPGKNGWLVGVALSVNFALAPQSPPTGVAHGAAGLSRANTLFFGAP